MWKVRALLCACARRWGPGFALVMLLASPAAAVWPGDPSVNVPLCTDPGDQIWSAVVTDGSGGAIVAWEDFRSDSSIEIYAQHVLADGTVDPSWPLDGRALSIAALGQYPEIASDSAGGAIVTWQDSRPGSNSDVYAQHVLASGVVDPAWPAAGLAVCSAGDSQLRPRIVTDGAGGAIITWYDYRSGYENSDIYAQHVMADGTMAPGWPADGLAVCAAVGRQIQPQIAMDGAGGAIVAWSDNRNGTDYHIYAQHVLAGGSVDPAWPVNGSALCLAPNTKDGPQVVPDGAGGALVAWTDRRSGTDSDIYAQHVMANGVVDPAWPTDGRAMCSGVLHYGDWTIPDDAGGAIVTWSDIRNGTDFDVYAQRVSIGGVTQWGVNGVALCTAAHDQSVSGVASDLAGGAIIAWQDFRGDTTSPHIYAQHVLAGGAVDPAWPADGRAVCTATGFQALPFADSDGAGGAIIAWTDHRSTSFDIYAQRVQSDGQLGGEGPTRLASLVSANADDRGVRITWFSPGGGGDAGTVYRRTEETAWLALASVHRDGTGLITFEDRSVEPGTRYGYRLGVPSPSGEQFVGETWLAIPRIPMLSLEGLRPNPANRDIVVAFSLPAAEPATVELVDLSGRVVVTRRIADARPGSQVVHLQNGRVLAPGIYLVRLTQGGRSIARKACVVD